MERGRGNSSGSETPTKEWLDGSLLRSTATLAHSLRSDFHSSTEPPHVVGNLSASLLSAKDIRPSGMRSATFTLALARLPRFGKQAQVSGGRHVEIVIVKFAVLALDVD